MALKQMVSNYFNDFVNSNVGKDGKEIKTAILQLV